MSLPTITTSQEIKNNLDHHRRTELARKINALKTIISEVNTHKKNIDDALGKNKEEITKLQEKLDSLQQEQASLNESKQAIYISLRKNVDVLKTLEIEQSSIEIMSMLTEKGDVDMQIASLEHALAALRKPSRT